MSNPSKILSVDDSKTIQRIIANASKVLDLETLTADNGKVALDVLEENSKDIALILLDWNMPVMSGLDVLKAVKQNPAWKHIPVMMVTTQAAKADMTEALQEGASNYLAKPFEQEDLVIKIMECLNNTMM
tara:strand:+ start:14507 stop:14896 length:390 start_codon:yes stop_codon:yes gene_type:complete